MPTPPTPPKRSSASSIHFLPQPATTAKPHLHRGGSSDAPLHTAPRRLSKHQHTNITQNFAAFLIASQSARVCFVSTIRPPLEQLIHLAVFASVPCRPVAVVRLPCLGQRLEQIRLRNPVLSTPYPHLEITFESLAQLIFGCCLRSSCIRVDIELDYGTQPLFV